MAFLEKKPLEWVVPDNTNSESAVALGADRGILILLHEFDAQQKTQPIHRLGFFLQDTDCLYGVTTCVEWLPWGTMTTAVGLEPVG